MGSHRLRLAVAGREGLAVAYRRIVRHNGVVISDTNRPTPLSCDHRGEQLRTMTSDLCGQRGKNIPVYYCRLHGECTHGQVCKGQDPSVRICLTCDDGPWAF